MERESAGPAEPTLADALFSSTKSTHFEASDTAGAMSAYFSEPTGRLNQLIGSSRALIKQGFSEAEP